MSDSQNQTYTPVFSEADTHYPTTYDSGPVDIDSPNLACLDYLCASGTSNPLLTRHTRLRNTILASTLLIIMITISTVIFIISSILAIPDPETALLGTIFVGLALLVGSIVSMVLVWNASFRRLHNVCTLQRRIVRKLNGDDEEAASWNSLEDEVDDMAWRAGLRAKRRQRRMRALRL